MQNLGRVFFLLLPAFFYIAGGFHSCFVVEMRLSFKNQFSWPCTVNVTVLEREIPTKGSLFHT